ncbi:cytochrome p450 [Ophiostoma piceae UAMH 11346]|uniref:Cytochrome p450 n=1 Tax=Ophiostoma piceae (strain UAMH 11346) TaxID=1262450 RepID=S3CDK5_OPHP1|nr:cytochrome p450 [Ophiostoma piceae UAMH 11346]
MFLLVTTTLFAVWFVSSAHRLYTNYRSAKLTGFPIVVCPVNPQNLLYVLVNAPLRPWLMRNLPPVVYNRFKVCTFGWQFFDRHQFHDAVGPVFVLVTTGVNQIWIADPAIAQVVLTRRKDFRTVLVTKQVMSLAGTNMIASDDEPWARQRRLIAPQLNERVSALVWAESMQQAIAMADYLSDDSKGKEKETVSSLRSIAINVLGQVGYGQPKPFRPLHLPRDPKAPMAYIDAVSLATELIVFAAFVPHKLLTLPIMPRLLQTLGVAMRRMPQLTADMLEQERQRNQSNCEADAITLTEKTETPRRETIMGLMVRLSDKQKEEEELGVEPTGGSGAGFLTEDEIHGNLFLVTGAGFDTTANTMSYAVVMLAVHEDKQRWIQEEVDSVFSQLDERPPGADVTELYYALYPKLVRCLAFVNECLRLYPPIMHISRETNRDQTITAHGQTHVLVGHYEVYVNNAALQTRAAFWGDDTDEFKPQRWISVDENGDEEVIAPKRGTFTPWSAGPRVCPGQKMAQVEIVVVFATLLWRCRVRPVRKDGETLQHAHARIMAVAGDSQPRMTLQMNRPDDLLLTWEKRR